MRTMCLAGNLWPGKVGAALGRVPPTACACSSLRPVLPFDNDRGWGGAPAALGGQQGKTCDDCAERQGWELRWETLWLSETGGELSTERDEEKRGAAKHKHLSLCRFASRRLPQPAHSHEGLSKPGGRRLCHQLPIPAEPAATKSCGPHSVLRLFSGCPF